MIFDVAYFISLIIDLLFIFCVSSINDLIYVHQTEF